MYTYNRYYEKIAAQQKYKVRVHRDGEVAAAMTIINEDEVYNIQSIHTNSTVDWVALQCSR